MTLFNRKSFTVPASSAKAPENCGHAWVDERRKRCVLCGEPIVTAFVVHPSQDFDYFAP